MKNKYYNEWEFKQAISFIETNPLISKLKLEKYLEKYSQDYSAYIYYISVLITLGEFTIAEEILKSIENSMKQLKISTKYLDKKSIDIVTVKLRLLSYQEKYDELYKCYQENIQEIQNMSLEINPLIFYCKKMLGIIDPKARERYNKTYLFRQIARYEEKDFLEHIQKHQANYNLDNTKLNPAIFDANFPLNDILTEIKKHIPSESVLYAHFYTDVYIFKFDGCGTVDNKLTDFFKVICFHNTNQVVTMYPSTDCQELPHIDLNYLMKNDNNPKIKRLSQTDKFNQRYSNFKL